MRLAFLGTAATIMLLLLCTGCDAIAEHPLESVPGDVVFTIVDRAEGEAPPDLYLGISTVDYYSSMCPLRLRSSVWPTIRAEVLGRDDRAICLTAFGPASGGFPLRVHDGTHDFEIVHRGQRDHYRITISGAKVEVETVRARASCHIDDLHTLEEARFCQVDPEP